MKDRLSIHIDNGQSDVREAVTVLRNGGTASQSGMVGITNAVYDPDLGSAYIPETIFNVQSTGDSNIRFSSGPSKDYRSSLELIGVGNTRASGLHITYDPVFDNAYVDADTGYGTYEPCVNPGVVDKTVVDFSLIRPSGKQGMEFSHISLSERGYVSIGLTRVHETRHVEANAPLTIAYACDYHRDSGTISMHEQASAPTTHADFGKIYVKPYSVGGRTQALYFKDDGGRETNLVLSQDLEPTKSTDGLIYGNGFGNTFGGWYTPERRDTSTGYYNTYYGFGAGFSLTQTADMDNTIIGYRAGSGLKSSLSNNVRRNTIIGSDSVVNLQKLEYSTVIGTKNLRYSLLNDENEPTGVILIGNDLYKDDVPVDNTLAIGNGQRPLIFGNLGGPNTSRHFTLQDAVFEVNTRNGNSAIRALVKSEGVTDTSIINIVDRLRSASNNPRNKLEFNFQNREGHGLTLFTLNPYGTYLTNSKNYAASTAPYAELDGDFRLRGSIRFADGTSLSSSNVFDSLLPVIADTGIRRINTGSAQKVVLDYRSLDLAGSVSDNITDANTFVAVQLDGSSSSNMGKMSLQGLSAYLGGGGGAGPSVVENCNVVILSDSATENLNTSVNKNSVFLGCEAGVYASGWVNSVMVGNAAGAYAKTPNGVLDVDSASVFVGYRAGYDIKSSYRTVCIGNSAGERANGSQDSIFIGSSAGSNSNYDKSIGIGQAALASTLGTTNAGSGNLEIYTGDLDNQRLFSPPALDSAGEPRALNDRMNIQNVIAGRSDRQNISIGDAILSPNSPLEVRRDSVIHSLNDNQYIQTWFCDDEMVAAMNCDGRIVKPGENEDREQYIEGFIQSTDNGMKSPNVAAIDAPTSGILRVYEDGAATDQYFYIKNRDEDLFIPNGTYVVATLIGQDYRPIWVSC